MGQIAIIKENKNVVNQKKLFKKNIVMCKLCNKSQPKPICCVMIPCSKLKKEFNKKIHSQKKKFQFIRTKKINLKLKLKPKWPRNDFFYTKHFANKNYLNIFFFYLECSVCGGKTRWLIYLFFFENNKYKNNGLNQ